MTRIGWYPSSAPANSKPYLRTNPRRQDSQCQIERTGNVPEQRAKQLIPRLCHFLGRFALDRRAKGSTRITARLCKPRAIISTWSAPQLQSDFAAFGGNNPGVQVTRWPSGVGENVEALFQRQPFAPPGSGGGKNFKPPGRGKKAKFFKRAVRSCWPIKIGVLSTARHASVAKSTMSCML